MHKPASWKKGFVSKLVLVLLNRDDLWPFSRTRQETELVTVTPVPSGVASCHEIPSHSNR